MTILGYLSMERVSIDETELERVLCATVAYYDLFEYPLTALELWQYAIAPRADEFSLGDIHRLLDESAVLGEKLGHDSGFYFLTGRSSICKTRRERSTLAVQKMKKAKRVALLLAAVPFVRFVAVCNTLGLRHASKESDIDLVLGARRGTLWIVRAASLLLMRSLGLRPRQRGIVRDTICICFFLSTDRLDLARIALPQKDGIGDVYTAGWIQHLVPLVDEEEVLERLVSNNAWARAIRPHLQSVIPASHCAVGILRSIRFVRSGIEWVLAPFIAPLERFAQSTQLTHLPPPLKSLLNTDTRVWADDSLLKFHPTDRRDYFRQEWMKRCNALGL